MRALRPLLCLLLLPALTAPAATAQTPPSPPRSPQKAFALSLLLPGLGHRYAGHGHWQGRGTLFALADAGLWVGLLATEWRRNSLTESFKTLAATRADAQVEGKDRTFFLNLASFHSSDEFVAVSLRNRAWDQVNYVQDRSFQWNWASEVDFQRFRNLRSDAESLRNRRLVLVAALVGNRLVSALLAVRAANRANRADANRLAVALTAPPPGGSLPQLRMRLGF